MARSSGRTSRRSAAPSDSRSARRNTRSIGVSADHRVHNGVTRRRRRTCTSPRCSGRSATTYLVARTRGDAGAAARRDAPRAARDGAGTRVRQQRDDGDVDGGVAAAGAGRGVSRRCRSARLGTLLAAIGLYGVIAFSVARRTREIGVRMAIGASAGAVLVDGDAAGACGSPSIGTGVGIGLAALAAQTLSGALYGVGAFDPVAWLVALTVLLAAAALANFIPARRAMRINPRDRACGLNDVHGVPGFLRFRGSFDEPQNPELEPRNRGTDGTDRNLGRYTLSMLATLILWPSPAARQRAAALLTISTAAQMQPTPESPRPARGTARTTAWSFAGVTVIDGTGAPPRGPMDIVDRAGSHHRDQQRRLSRRCRSAIGRVPRRAPRKSTAPACT